MEITELSLDVVSRGPKEASKLLETQADSTIAQVLQNVNPSVAQDILEELPAGRIPLIMAAAPPEFSRQWIRNRAYPEDSIGRLMDPPVGIFSPKITVRHAIDQLRELVKDAFITYAFTVDDAGKLVGVVVMRELLFAEDQQTLEQIMIQNPFCLKPDMPLVDAMKSAISRHYPVYPVCDDSGRLVGLVRGQTLFEAQAFEISAQAGSMVGVEKEERLSTPWPRSLKSRHPWLQLNLFTAFVAGGVVSFFQNTINEIVILAAFLPVLAGQSGNTGCQALAVALRGLTLGDLKKGSERRLVLKEALLGLLNGALVGVTAGIGMFLLGSSQKHPQALPLAGIVFLAMTGSCAVSGVSGALVPLILKRLGADPATASSIFLTTATDVASMGLLLSLATWLLL
jgi:magnesium transporter